MNSPEIPEFAQLPPTEDPPPELEERIVAELRRRHRIARPGPPGGSLRWLVAACLLAAVGGWMARGWLESPKSESTSPRSADSGPAAESVREPPAPMAGEYLLLLVEQQPLRTSKSLAVLVDEYRSWAAGIADRGRLISAGRLHPGGPYLADTAAEPAGIGNVTGFFIVKAGSLEEAERLAATCPHRAYGGEISVRPLAGTSGPPQS